MARSKRLGGLCAEGTWLSGGGRIAATRKGEKKLAFPLVGSRQEGVRGEKPKSTFLSREGEIVRIHFQKQRTGNRKKQERRAGFKILTEG